MELISSFRKKIYEKEVGLVKDYNNMYKGGVNQMKVFEFLAEKYGYSSADSVRTKFQSMKKKYKILNVIEIKKFYNII